MGCSTVYIRASPLVIREKVEMCRPDLTRRPSRSAERRKQNATRFRAAAMWFNSPEGILDWFVFIIVQIGEKVQIFPIEAGFLAIHALYAAANIAHNHS